MNSESNQAETFQERARLLFSLTLDKLLQRVKSADDENPLSASEIAAIGTILKNSNVTAANADALGGTKKKPLSMKLPSFSAPGAGDD